MPPGLPAVLDVGEGEGLAPTLPGAPAPVGRGVDLQEHRNVIDRRTGLHLYQINSYKERGDL